jgi:two-component sensor histidine kinase/sensor domain CHASE-containing protein
MRRRITLVIALAVAAMLAINYAATRLVIMRGYSALESRYIEKDVTRLLRALQAEQEDLARTAADWASWDEMYAFTASPSRVFSETNLTDEALTNVKVDILIVADLAGKPVFTRAVGEPDGSGGRSLAGLLARMSADPRLLMRGAAGLSSMGTARIGDGVVFFAVHPITNSAGTAPVRGSLVLSRPLDEDEAARIGHQLSLSVALFPFGSAGNPPDVRAAAAAITPRDPIRAAALDGRTVAGYALVRDRSGAPVLVARVDSPRDINAQGIRTLWYATAWLALIGVAFGAVVLLYLEGAVLSRVHALSASVLRIGTSQDLSLRTAMSGTDQLAYLGAAINGLMDTLSSSTAELRQSEARGEAFLAALPDVLFRLKRDGTILDYRWPPDAPYRALPPGILGMNVRDVPSLYPLVGPQVVEEALAAMGEAAPSAPRIFEFPTVDNGVRRLFEARLVAAGPDEFIALVHEITDRKAREEAERKEVLLKEIHHRVKNNLQVISSLLDLQARAAGDPVTARLLRESKDRVRSMALIHEKLYQAGGAEGVLFPDYVKDLTARLCHSFACSADTVSVEVEAGDLSLDMDSAVPLGIIINELLTNALKYAYPGGSSGKVRVTMRREGPGVLCLALSDDGVGLPAGMDWRNPSTLGLRIVNTLVTQLRGTLSVGPGPGASFTVTFPAPETPPRAP